MEAGGRSAKGWGKERKAWVWGWKHFYKCQGKRDGRQRKWEGQGSYGEGTRGTGEGVKVRVPRGHEEEGGEVGEERGEEGEKDERRREGEITECNNDARQRFSASQATKTLLAISRCKITLREIPIAFRHYVLYVCSFI